MVIARRSVRLSKTYVGLAVFFAGFAILITSLPVSAPPPTGAVTPPFDVQLFFRFLALPFLTLPTLTLTTPVMLLFVYDKNNGVLEYLLSLGKDQTDVFMAYLKAAILLASIMFLCEIVVYIAVGVLIGVSLATLLLVSGLILALSLSAVSFVTVVMMAFSSLQKQRVGANQPLGTGLGVFLVMPSVFIPLASSSIAVLAELVYSITVIVVGLAALVAAGKLISREKLLP